MGATYEIAPEVDVLYAIWANESDVFFVVEDGVIVALTEYGKQQTELNVPDKLFGKDVVGIASFAFSGNSVVESVTISGNVATIGTQAFYGCTALTDVVFDGTEDDWANVKKALAWAPEGVNVSFAVNE